MTSVTIILFDKTFRKTLPSFKQIFLLKTRKQWCQVKITTKHANNSGVKFVTHKRFAVVLFLPSCCVSWLALHHDSHFCHHWWYWWEYQHLYLLYNNDIILICTVEGREDHFSYAEFSWKNKGILLLLIKAWWLFKMEQIWTQGYSNKCTT